MKNNQSGQANPDKSGSKSNQKTAEVSKKEMNPNSQPVKKGKQSTSALDPEEMEEGTTIEDSTDETSEEKRESKTGKQTGKR